MRKFTEQELERIDDIVTSIVGDNSSIFIDTEIQSLIRFEDGYCETYTLEHLEQFIEDEYGMDVVVDMGASKLVIMEMGQDYVIKVPLDGVIQARFDEDAEEEEDYNNLYYYDITDARYSGYDYCAIEMENYNKMPENIKSVFCETVKLGTLLNNRGYYAQEKVTYLFERMTKKILDFSEEERDRAYKVISSTSVNEDINYLYELKTPIVIEMIKSYGETTAHDIYEALIKFKINDIHYGNLGYNDRGDLKIFDFSGFKR